MSGKDYEVLSLITTIHRTGAISSRIWTCSALLVEALRYTPMYDDLRKREHHHTKSSTKPGQGHDYATSNTILGQVNVRRLSRLGHKAYDSPFLLNVRSCVCRTIHPTAEWPEQQLHVISIVLPLHLLSLYSSFVLVFDINVDYYTLTSYQVDKLCRSHCFVRRT